MYEYDNTYVVVALDAAQSLAQLGSAVTGLEVRTATRTAALDVGPRLLDTLGMKYRVIDWQQQNSQLFTALQLEKLGMTVICRSYRRAFNIVSTLIMVVTDKTGRLESFAPWGCRRGRFCACSLRIDWSSVSLGPAPAW
jgi:lipoprotein-releasing system permease protein